jgi:hypothetical protein
MSVTPFLCVLHVSGFPGCMCARVVDLSERPGGGGVGLCANVLVRMELEGHMIFG